MNMQKKKKKNKCEFLGNLKFFAFLGKGRDLLLTAHLWLLGSMLIYYEPGLIIAVYLKTTYAKGLPVWKHIYGLGEIGIRNRFQDKQECSPVLIHIWNTENLIKMEITLVPRLKKDKIQTFFTSSIHYAFFQWIMVL